jgi:plastocyanin
MTLRTHRYIRVSTIVLGLGIMFAACSDDDSTNPPPGNFNGTIHVQDSRFSPANVTIEPGDSVTWVWDGSLSHTVTHGTSPTVPPDAQKLFDTPLKTSGTFGFRFNNAGTFAYFCRAHFNMGMKGTITVQP